MPFAAELYEAGARIGLWNITESEAALRTGITLSPASMSLINASGSAKRRRELLAVRSLMHRMGISDNDLAHQVGSGCSRPQRKPDPFGAFVDSPRSDVQTRRSGESLDAQFSYPPAGRRNRHPRVLPGIFGHRDGDGNVPGTLPRIGRLCPGGGFPHGSS